MLRGNSSSPPVFKMCWHADYLCFNKWPPHWCRSSFTNFLAQNILFMPPFPCVLGTFSKGHSVRELRTQCRNEQALRELGWELAVGCSIFAARVQFLNFTGNWHDILSRILCTKSPRIFSALLSSVPFWKNPRRIHATFGAKIHANIWNLFPLPVVSLACSTLICVAAFGRRYFYAWPMKICKLTISVLGTSNDTTQGASSQWLDFPGQKFTPDPLCACAALNKSPNNYEMLVFLNISRASKRVCPISARASSAIQGLLAKTRKTDKHAPSKGQRK